MNGFSGAIPGRRWQILSQLERTAIGKTGAEGSVAVRRSAKAGCVLYGPFWRLAAGLYRLSFRCNAWRSRMSSQPVVGVEVIVMDRIQLSWRDFTFEELGFEPACIVFRVPFELSLEGAVDARFEFRFFHLGNAGLSISEIDLVKLPGEETAPISPSEWRMLGRLQKSRMGKRHKSGVTTVGERAPAGCLLFGGWPYLRLAKGSYRLTAKCKAGPPRNGAEPVMAIEVIAQSKWRQRRSWLSPLRASQRGYLWAWKDFTAAELQEGSARVDFAVPLELSIEAGEFAPFELRLHHLGNAGLAIESVDLRRLHGEELALQPPTEWRHLRQYRKGFRVLGRGRSRADERRAIHYRGYPPLRLPEGRYHVTFACRAASATAQHGELLRVDVIARTKSSDGRSVSSLTSARTIELTRRHYQATELRLGSATAEFEVPIELGQRASDTTIEIVFRPLVDEYLTIDALRVREAANGPPEQSLRPARSTMSRRTKIVFVGNCQSDPLRQGFLHTPYLNKLFDAKYHSVLLPRHLYDVAKRDLEECDILLVQDIQNWDEFPLRSNVRDDVNMIKFPGLRFASPWPFDAWNGPTDRVALARDGSNLVFPHLDGLLARLRKEVPDKEKRFRVYRSLQWSGIVNYKRLHELETLRLLALDAKFGVQMGAFVLENFQRKQVFYTTVRPNLYLLDQLMRYVLKSIGVSGSHPLPKSLLAILRTPQVPVHPKVAQDLGISWADEKTRYLYRGKRITWESYIRSYIDHYG